MIIKQSHLKISNKLKKYKINNYRKEAEMLLSFVLNKSKEFLYTYPEYKLNIFQTLYVKHLIKKRLKGYSLAVLTGEKEFYGYQFKVNKHVLVPRPETEMMIDCVVNFLSNNFKNKYTLIDIGTGTGCIAISILNELKKFKLSKTVNSCYAVDISNKALKIAKENAKFHQINNFISFFQGNLLEPITKKIKQNTSHNNLNEHIILTANLPYLTPNQVKTSPSIKKEPKLALVAGIDGLKYYRNLFAQIKLLKNKNVTALCEIDSSQKKNISKLIKTNLPKYNFQIKKDLRNLERLVIINNNSNRK